MKNLELKNLIEEEVLKRLKEDPDMITKLMMAYENRMDSTLSETGGDFTLRTIKALMEHMEIEEDEIQSPENIERERMRKLL